MLRTAMKPLAILIVIAALMILGLVGGAKESPASADTLGEPITRGVSDDKGEMPRGEL